MRRNGIKPSSGGRKKSTTRQSPRDEALSYRLQQRWEFTLFPKLDRGGCYRFDTITL